MPVISRFLGIAIAILYRDHAPPHFHATYGDFEITVAIRDGAVNGRFPPRALAHVLEWAGLHRDELLIAPAPMTRYTPSHHWSKLLGSVSRGGSMLHVAAVRPLSDARLWVRFDDGVEGEVDLSAELTGAVFMPLKDPVLFAKAAIDPDTRTVTWPNGADFAPEFLAGLLVHRNR